MLIVVMMALKLKVHLLTKIIVKYLFGFKNTEVDMIDLRNKGVAWRMSSSFVQYESPVLFQETTLFYIVLCNVGCHSGSKPNC